MGMKMNSLIQYHIKNISSMTRYDAMHYLSEKRFDQIGSGCESVVYSRKGCEYVIKLCHDPFYNSGNTMDIPDLKHFANRIVIKTEHFSIVVQEKVNEMVSANYCRYSNRFKVFSRWVRSKYKVRDIHDNNVGLVRGRFVVIDWNMDI